MYPPFPQEKAKSILQKLSPFIKENSTVGVLIALDGQNCKHILVATSGIASSSPSLPPATKNLPIEIAPPIVPSKSIQDALFPNDKEIHLLTDLIKHGGLSPQEIASKKQRRTILTTQSLMRVFDLYEFSTFDGKKKKLLDITGGKLPPTGTGDCVEPKLLNYTFSRKWSVDSMAVARFSCDAFSAPKIDFVAPCDARCGLILPAIIGLKIIYQDAAIVVVDKQAGLLSVPGRGSEKSDSVATRIRRLFPAAIAQPAVHRLDMETSGLMVLALTKEAHVFLNHEFEARRVKKEYLALLDGVVLQKEGTITLKHRCDIENRPHQIIDNLNGKEAITKFSVKGINRLPLPPTNKDATQTTSPAFMTVTRVAFTPLTGRTHQIRIAARFSKELGTPIVGDALYNEKVISNKEPRLRLMLHASSLEFLHPTTKIVMHFESNPSFLPNNATQSI